MKSDNHLAFGLWFGSAAPRDDSCRAQTSRALASAPHGWSSLQAAARHRQLHFDRLSASIADFCAPRRKLIVELDGSQHLEQEEYDLERTAYFESKGYRVIRFWNNDVENNMETVLKVIWSTLNEEERRDGRKQVMANEERGEY